MAGPIAEPSERSSNHPPVLSIHGLRKSFGSRHALQGVSFDLKAGERLAFLGPNGAGKTTLIRCLCGRCTPDAGTIQLLDRPIDDLGVRQAIGLVPQEIAIYPDLTTRENLTVFAKFHGLRRDALVQRVDWALRWTGLQDRASELVGGFSGGMKRRVNLACGVMHSPQVLLLDEPTVGVDPQSREKIFTMLDQLNQQGTSILLTTHHLDEAESRSDRIVIMDQGQVVADGTIGDLVRKSVGPSRMVKLRLDRPLEQAISLLPDDDGWSNNDGECVATVGQREIRLRIGDVAQQLPELLRRVKECGYDIADVEVHAPSLHHVFLHLTGRELRE
ncbi:Doxorubicin resistance ATP-binding protein DrrA [Rubripirellula lacrimiformis]|uniref:Doxorubicin resistance ATP-binding protein DrrA n=1 Tax=Rubripirellula lacrimiformis TaxID=1930273 RepID=A0A517N9E6_9BACT|nr:ABC transporter ATP-binding protein [Rubripirellula lacrimiformis]QDT03618.1 Doxorubicin resistance ATP-binding protein DrrA [Rubripirellula lacrimiformis]